MIAGFEMPTEGAVELGGVDVTRKAPFERDVNTVFRALLDSEVYRVVALRTVGVSPR